MIELEEYIKLLKEYLKIAQIISSYNFKVVWSKDNYTLNVENKFKIARDKNKWLFIPANIHEKFSSHSLDSFESWLKIYLDLIKNV